MLLNFISSNNCNCVVIVRRVLNTHCCCLQSWWSTNHLKLKIRIRMSNQQSYHTLANSSTVKVIVVIWISKTSIVPSIVEAVVKVSKQVTL